jgi:hypothetical protein
MLVQRARNRDFKLKNGSSSLFSDAVWQCVQQSRVDGDDSMIDPCFALNLFWSCSFFLLFGVSGMSDAWESATEPAIDPSLSESIIAMMVGNTTPTGFVTGIRHSEMG